VLGLDRVLFVGEHSRKLIPHFFYFVFVFFTHVFGCTPFFLLLLLLLRTVRDVVNSVETRWAVAG
jgi:hypothetical protein